jgi:hypothetical protein
MDDTTNEPVIEIEEPVIDATDLVIGETVIDDENYDEIVIDLRKREHHDAWLV